MKSTKEINAESTSKLAEKLTVSVAEEIKFWELEIEESRLQLDKITELGQLLGVSQFPFDLPEIGQEQNLISPFSPKEIEKIKVKIFELIDKL